MNDNQLTKALRKSLIEMPFGDFDQRMMLQVKKEAASFEKTKRDRNIASLFFMLGCLFGIVGAGLVAFSHEIDSTHLKGISQAVTVTLVFLFINSVYEHFYKQKRGHLKSR